MANLLTNQTTNGSGSAVSVSSGGYRIVRFYGTFDSCTVTVECDFGDGNWVPAQDTAQSVTGVIYLQCAVGMRIRATLASAGVSTDVTVDFI